MGICGVRTRERESFSIRRWVRPDWKHRGILRPEKRFCIVCFTLTLFLAGCATTAKFGSPPKVNELSTLTQGISRKSDVLAAFGEPRGYGAGLFSPDIATQEIWFYEYMETDGVKTDLKFLLFFFDKDLYNGHLWFSSSSLMDTGE